MSNPHNSTAQYWTTTQFDALGRATETIGPDSSQATYTYSKNTVTVTDPAGKQRESVSDGLGRITSVDEPDMANGNSLTQVTSYTYSVLDDIKTVTQGVQTRTSVYDDIGRLTSATTPESGTVSYQYNSFDLVTQRTDARGVVTTYTYDSLNRPYQVSYNVGSSGVAATPTMTFTYDEGGAAANAVGRLTTMADGVGTGKYTYNILGQTTQLQKVINGTTYTTQYAYNLAGELSSITYPSGRVVLQNYDAVGRLCAVGASGATCLTGTNYANGFAYNPAGEVTTFNYGNGVAANMTYLADRLQMTALSYTKAPTTLLSMNYWYKTDATNCPNAPAANNGQIQCITDGVDSGRNETFTYDALYRLTSAVTKGSAGYPQWGLSFTYDRYGNRTAQTVTAGTAPANSLSFSASGGALTNHADNYAYDLNGNMTNDGSNTLTYDAENRLLTSSGSGGAGTYTYDGNGLRVKKVSGSTTTVYIFSGSKVVAEYDNGAAPSSPSREYVYLGSQLLAKFESSGTTYYHPDHLSNRVLSDASGASVGQLGNYPFGESWYETGTTTKLKFTSYERDGESGNDYAQARFDVNRFGRFLTPDPVAGGVANPQSLNRYAYVQNDPINSADPSGMLMIPGYGFVAWGGGGFGSNWGEFAFMNMQIGTMYHFYQPDGQGFNFLNYDFQGLMAETQGGELSVTTTPIYGSYLIDPGEGGGGGPGNQTEKTLLARARALLNDPKCKSFIQSTLNRIDPKNSSYSQFESTVLNENVSMSKTPNATYPDAAATALPPENVTLYPLFQQLSPGAQSGVFIHEAFHLGPFRFTDQQLAGSIFPNFKNLPTAAASSTFNQFLFANCRTGSK